MWWNNGVRGNCEWQKNTYWIPYFDFLKYFTMYSYVCHVFQMEKQLPTDEELGDTEIII